MKIIERAASVVIHRSAIIEALRALKLITQEDESASVNISPKERHAKRTAISALERGLRETLPTPGVCVCGHHVSYHKTGPCSHVVAQYGTCACPKFKQEGARINVTERTRCCAGRSV